MLAYAHHPDRRLLEEELASFSQVLERDPARIAAAYREANLAFHRLQLDRVIRIAALHHALGAPRHDVLPWLQNAAGLTGEAMRRAFPCGPLEFAEGIALAIVAGQDDLTRQFVQLADDIWLGPNAPRAPGFEPLDRVLRQGAGGASAGEVAAAALEAATPVRPYHHADMLVPLALAALGALPLEQALQRYASLAAAMAHHPAQRAATFMLLDLPGLAFLAHARARGAAAPTGLPANLPVSLLPEGQWDIR